MSDGAGERSTVEEAGGGGESKRAATPKLKGMYVPGRAKAFLPNAAISLVIATLVVGLALQPQSEAAV